MSEKKSRIVGPVEVGRNHYDGLLLGGRVRMPGGRLRRVEATIVPKIISDDQSKEKGEPIGELALQITARHLGTIVVGSVLRGEVPSVNGSQEVEIKFPRKVSITPTPGDRFTKEGLIAYGLPKSARYIEEKIVEVETEQPTTSE